MGFRLFGKKKGSDINDAVAEILPVASEPSACDPTKCDCTWNSKAFSPIDTSSTLWESSKAPAVHLLVSTGSTDWAHDAFGESGSLLKEISKFDLSPYGQSKLNATSLSGDIMDPAYKHGDKVDILLMPYFIWLRGVTRDNYAEALKTVLDHLVLQKDTELSQLPSSVAGATVAADPNRSYVFLCSHATRDKRCGRTAPIMKKEFDAQLRDQGLYRDFGDDRADGVTVTFTNHVGGHKFAANVMIYNKSGAFAWYARCTPLNVKPLIDDTILQGKVFPDISRIVKKNSPVNW